MKFFASHSRYHRRRFSSKRFDQFLGEFAGDSLEPLKLDKEGFDSLVRKEMGTAQAPIRLIGAEPAAVQFDHLTLTTGHNRVSPVGEADQDLNSCLRPYLEQAVNGEFVTVPLDVKPDGWSIKGTVFGDSLVLTVYGPCLDMGEEGGQADRLPIITMVASPGGADGHELWKKLHQGHQHLATWGKEAPEAAWCGVRLEIPGSLVYKSALPWIAEFERHVTWCWLSARVIADHGGDAAFTEPEMNEVRAMLEMTSRLRSEIAAGMGMSPSDLGTFLDIDRPDVTPDRALALLFGFQAALGSVAAISAEKHRSRNK